MNLIDKSNWASFRACIGVLLESEQVQSMRQIPHHPGVCCYEHSVFVAYVAFRLARRWGLDYSAAARGGLLHDLYLYDAHDKTAYTGWQCFTHPKEALKNADALVENLSPRERNIIISHMWPLALHLPRCKEAFVVNLADKFCCTAELMGYWRRSLVREMAMT